MATLNAQGTGRLQMPEEGIGRRLITDSLEPIRGNGRSHSYQDGKYA